MDEPWDNNDEMRADFQAVSNLAESMARFMEDEGCCETCVAKVRGARREAERQNAAHLARLAERRPRPTSDSVT